MLYDAIIIGAGPGGLSAAIYLGRAHKKTLVLYAGPRRTAHAVHIQNYFGFEDITGPDLIERGMKQAERYGAEIVLVTVKNIAVQKDSFDVETAQKTYFAKNVIVASGVMDIFPEIDNLFEFLGKTFFTCITCDGYHLTDERVAIIGNGDASARTAMGVRQIYTKKDLYLLTGPQVDISEPYRKRLEKEGVKIIPRDIKHFNGNADGTVMKSVTLNDGSVLELDCVLSDLGSAMNDSFLSGIDLKRDERGKIETFDHYESSVPNLFVVGPMNTGHDQVSIAVGEGAQAAMMINKRAYDFSV